MKLFVRSGLALWMLELLLDAVSAESTHLPIHKRGGRFSRHEPADLARLSQVLSNVEARYANSYRDVEHNGLVRRWHQKDPVIEDVAMFEGTGGEGNWYASVTIGDPPQKLELDLDMLHSDFFTLMTTSGKGQRYNTTNSKTHGKNVSVSIMGFEEC